jgi:hypothetical protein
LSVYRVEETRKEKFVANAVQVEMQRCHSYIIHHASKVANVTITYRAKHGIVDSNMV